MKNGDRHNSINWICQYGLHNLGLVLDPQALRKVSDSRDCSEYALRRVWLYVGNGRRPNEPSPDNPSGIHPDGD